MPNIIGPGSGYRHNQQRTPDEDAPDYQAYIDNVYRNRGTLAGKPEAQKAIETQYDYNLRRVQAGKPPLWIADPSWNPDDVYDDATNEWMAQHYQKTGKLPTGEEQFDHLQRSEAERKNAEGFAAFMAATNPENGGNAGQ